MPRTMRVDPAVTIFNLQYFMNLYLAERPNKGFGCLCTRVHTYIFELKLLCNRTLDGFVISLYSYPRAASNIKAPQGVQISRPTY